MLGGRPPPVPSQATKPKGKTPALTNPSSQAKPNSTTLKPANAPIELSTSPQDKSSVPASVSRVRELALQLEQNLHKDRTFIQENDALLATIQKELCDDADSKPEAAETFFDARTTTVIKNSTKSVRYGSVFEPDDSYWSGHAATPPVTPDAVAMASVQNSSTPAVPEKPSQKKPIPPLRRKLPRMHSPPPTPSKVHNSPSLPTPPKASPPPPPPMPSRAPRLSWSRSDDPFFRYVQNTYSKADHFGFVSWEQPETKSNLAKVLEGENSRAAKWRAMAIEVPVSPALKEVAASERAFGMRGLVAITSAETVPVKVAISPIFSFTKNERFLQRIWKGLPHVWRGYVWYHLITTSSGLYNGLDADEISQMESEELGRYLAKAREGKVSKFDKVITSDAAQTFVNHILFMTEDSAGRTSLRRILSSFSFVYPDIGFSPGLLKMTATLLLVMEEERVFMSLMHLYSDEEHFNLGMLHTQTQETLDELFFVQENLLRLWAPRLHAKMISFGIRPAAYASSWYTTLFHVCLPAAYTAREGQVVAKNATGLIPFRIFIRLWDIFMLNGFNFLPVIAVSLLKQFEGLLLLSRNKTDILSFLVQDPHETLNPGDRPKSSWPSSEADEESFFRLLNRFWVGSSDSKQREIAYGNSVDAKMGGNVLVSRLRDLYRQR